MVKALFDTNVLIDYLNTVPQADQELARYSDKAISIITWIEVMAGASRAVEAGTRSFLDDFEILQLDERISEEAAAIRRNHRVKLPDAIIWASARISGLLLVTRNVKDFPRGEPGIRMPYKL
jgi:predicted nucleic acid-binding protein